MKYDVLTLDTQVFASNNFAFDEGWLAQVKQFKDGPTGVVISSVVTRETRRLLAEKIRLAKEALESAAKDAVHYGLDVQPLTDKPLMTGTPQELATKRIKAYLEAVGAPIVPVRLITVEQLMAQYFKAAPPFATTGKKKAEFPDAVALMTLEAWAKAEGKRVLAVSGDGDWISFAEKSSYIDAVPTLKDALVLLQEHAEEAEALVGTLLTEIDQDGGEAAKVFKAKLAPEVADASVDPVIETSQQAEVEGGAELALIAFALAGEAPEFDFKVVRAGPWVLAASIDIRLAVKATAYVSFYGWDSIDKEAFLVGGVVAERELEDLEATVIATWIKDLLEEEWSLTSVELVSVADPYFGYVGMDWSGQDLDEPELEDQVDDVEDEASEDGL